MKRTGLFIGRFQPFHLGHLSAVKQALQQVDFLTIGIGSSQYSNTQQNPYTAEQRKKMIELSLQEAGIKEGRYEVKFIPDIHDNLKWPTHVKTITPHFEVLFLSNHGLVDQLFKKYMPEVKRVYLKHEVDISATRIREMMKKGNNWEKWVSEKVANHLKSR